MDHYTLQTRAINAHFMQEGLAGGFWPSDIEAVDKGWDCSAYVDEEEKAIILRLLGK